MNIDEIRKEDPLYGMAETHKLDAIYKELLEQRVKNEKCALAFGMLIGQLSGVLNIMAAQDRHEVGQHYHDLYKELKDIWQAAGMQIHAIYYKDSVWENLESFMKFRGR
jgi:hypothetical protein